MNAARTFALGLALSLTLGAGSALAAAGKAAVPHANLDAGIAAVEAQDYRNAVKQLEIAIVADPKNPEPYFRLAQAHRELGNFRRALKYSRLALTIEPNHLGALRERGMTLMAAGQEADAKMALDQLGEKCGRTCPEYESLKRRIDAGPAKKDG